MRGVAGSLVSPVLVGREAELRLLADALGRALAGESGVVLVSGEAGVGKSRLVQELGTRADEAGARLLVGGCVEFGGGGIPFAPLVEVLRELAGDVSSEELAGLLGPARPEMARLLPELAHGELPPPGGDAANTPRVLELV